MQPIYHLDVESKQENKRTKVELVSLRRSWLLAIRRPLIYISFQLFLCRDEDINQSM